MKTTILLPISLCLFWGVLAHAADVSKSFEKIYDQNKTLTEVELSQLRKSTIVFIPGLLAENFVRDDEYSRLDFSLITRDYFGSSFDYLRDRYGIKVERIFTSSKDVQQTQNNIRNLIDSTEDKNRGFIFISHSMGGLVLLDFLIKNPQYRHRVKGNVFLQSPFFGSVISDIFDKNYFYLRTILTPILPFLNTSDKVVGGFSIGFRGLYMQENKAEITDIMSEIPAITFAGRIKGQKSIFKLTDNIIKYGCLKAIRGFCLTKRIHNMPLDFSDGVVPVESSKLPGVDYIIKDYVDHAETVVSIPFKNISQRRLIKSLLRVLMIKYDHRVN